MQPSVSRTFYLLGLAWFHNAQAIFMQITVLLAFSYGFEVTIMNV